MKKFTCFLLVLLMLLTSCGGNAAVSDSETTAAQNDTTAVSIEKNRLDELGDKDFTGKTLSILDANNMPDVHQNMHSGGETGDTINDALFQRDSFINSKYNAEIKYEQVTSGGAAKFSNSVLAGDRDYDLIISVINDSVGKLANEGMLANLISMDYLTLDAEWWSPLVYEKCQINDIMYYTTGDFAPSIYCAPGCIFMNKKLANDYNISIDGIYNSVLDGVWTGDSIYTITKDMTRDLNNDDKLTIEDDFFGLMNETGSLQTAVFVVGAGADLSSTNTSGDIYLNLDNEKMSAIIEKTKSFVCKITKSTNNGLHDAFKADRALFFAHYVSSAYTRYRDMESDFAILPIPKYDEKQTTYRSLLNTWSNSFIGAAANASDEYIPFLMEAMAYYSRENIRPVSYEKAFLTKGARNERDAEMLDIIFSTLYLDFNFIENFGGSLDALTKAIFKDASFSSEWASINIKVHEAMNKFVEDWVR